jgi:hypothetical protein
MSQTTATKAAPATEASKRAVQTQPTYDEIRARAYEIFLSRNGAPGDEVEDWLQAERELRTK